VLTVFAIVAIIRPELPPPMASLSQTDNPMDTPRPVFGSDDSAVFLACKECDRRLTTAEVAERFCEACASATSPVERREGQSK